MATLNPSSNRYDWYVKAYFFTSLIALLASIFFKYTGDTKHDTTKVTENQESFKRDSSTESLVHLTCKNGNCERDSLKVKGGTLHAGRRIEENSKLLEIPKEMQIGCLDALRDNFVKTNLIGARHSQTNQFLVEDAFLAAYLAVLTKRNAAVENSLGDDEKHTISSIYLESLPTYDDYKSYHPVTFDLRELDSLYGTHTHIYYLISKTKEEIESEYEAFTRASTEFGNLIGYQDYIAARLNVQTRAFEGGPLSAEDAPLKELEWYANNFGVDIHKNAAVMVPIFDSLTSDDKKRNVDYKYEPESKSFVASASKKIRRGTEVLITRGNSGDLFGIYGFVYGDFSERTSVLLGSHQMVDERVVSKTTHIAQQKNEMIVYLQQDDGYKECVGEDDVLAMRFKRLKRKALLSIVNEYNSWIVSFPALDRDMEDDASIKISVDGGVNQIVSTSRLLAVSHKDYDGDAYNILKAAMEEIESNGEDDGRNSDKLFTLKKGGSGLEYRTHVWVWRLASDRLNRYCGADHEAWTCSAAERQQRHAFDEKSKEWNAAYVRYQEKVALETLREFALQKFVDISNYAEDYNPDADEFFYRNSLCPVDSPGLKQLIYE